MIGEFSENNSDLFRVGKKTKSCIGDRSTSWHIGKGRGARRESFVLRDSITDRLSLNKERGSVKLNFRSKKCCDGSFLPCLLAEGCVVVIRAANHNPILVASSSIRDISKKEGYRQPQKIRDIGNHQKIRIGKCQTVDIHSKSEQIGGVYS